MIELLRRSELARRLAGGGAAGLGARLGKVLCGVAAAALLARLLSPAGFGVFVLGQAIAVFGSLVAVLGLENTLVREVARFLARGEHARIGGTLRAARRLVLLGAGVVAAVLVVDRGGVLRWLFDEPGLAAVAGWIAAWVGLEALNRVQVSTLRGRHRLAVSAALDGFVGSVVFLASVSWLAATGPVELERVFLAAALSSGVSAAAGWWLLMPSRSEAAVARERSRAGEEGAAATAARPGVPARVLWSRSWPLLGATALGFLGSQGDLWLVGVVATSESAALYGAALKLIFLVGLPLLVVNRTLSSTMAEFHSRGRIRELEVLLRSTTTAVAAATSLVVLGLILFGGGVLSLVFGDFYARATPILLLLAAAQVVYAGTGPCGTLLMMAGHERLLLAVSALSGAYLVVGSLWAGAAHGVLGVAAVSASATVLNNLATLALVRWRVGLWSHAYLSPFRARRGLRRMVRIAMSHAS